MDITAMIQEFYIPLIFITCYIIGVALKKASFFNDNYIPIVMLVIGGISGALMNGISYEAIATGIVSGGAATCFDQVIKQLKKSDGYSI